MNKRETIPVITVTSLLLIYCLLIVARVAPLVILIIYVLSPFLITWMVYSIIRHGSFKAKELHKEEDWGYADTNKEDLGAF
jgi:fatty acid desaturase